ncbi:hypothetical protein FB45DRAFT_875912 [Roridomyces roridus]|uniref:Uncharacterized protein n=1 Tax=Roridomyces roridus TaxID=1738132 RepID=A0AAD7F980_9AGAR|nr:hypothetical protein FB45DRAFT_875912 [Roridomyces roridus]
MWCVRPQCERRVHRVHWLRIICLGGHPFDSGSGVLKDGQTSSHDTALSSTAQPEHSSNARALPEVELKYSIPIVLLFHWPTDTQNLLVHFCCQSPVRENGSNSNRAELNAKFRFKVQDMVEPNLKFRRYFDKSDLTSPKIQLVLELDRVVRFQARKGHMKVHCVIAVGLGPSFTEVGFKVRGFAEPNLKFRFRVQGKVPRTQTEPNFDITIDSLQVCKTPVQYWKRSHEVQLWRPFDSTPGFSATGNLSFEIYWAEVGVIFY